MRIWICRKYENVFLIFANIGEPDFEVKVQIEAIKSNRKGARDRKQ